MTPALVSTPIVLLAALDPVARDSAAVGLLLDLPDAVVVTHDLVSVPGSGGSVRRIITDATGVVAQETTPLEHACLTCTVREDIVPTLAMVLARGRWGTIVLALPLAAAPEQIAYAVNAAIDDQTLCGARLSSVVSLVAADTLVEDLLGDDLLAERNISLGTMDCRAVGEALASQLEFADVVVTIPAGDSQAMTLLRHVISARTQLHTDWQEISAGHLVGMSHDSHQARLRVDPLAVRPPFAEDDSGVWTIDLRSGRPLHPRRLLDRVEDLGRGRIRGRGHFWLPSRPGVACAWDGAGGQLSIGEVGGWDNRLPQTRLVVTGVDARDRRRIAHTFGQVVMTAEEFRSRDSWRGVNDGFEPWLGQNTAAA